MRPASGGGTPTFSCIEKTPCQPAAVCSPGITPRNPFPPTGGGGSSPRRPRTNPATSDTHVDVCKRVHQSDPLPVGRPPEPSCRADPCAMSSTSGDGTGGASEKERLLKHSSPSYACAHTRVASLHIDQDVLLKGSPRLNQKPAKKKPLEANARAGRKHSSQQLSTCNIDWKEPQSLVPATAVIPATVKPMCNTPGSSRRG